MENFTAEFHLADINENVTGYGKLVTIIKLTQQDIGLQLQYAKKAFYIQTAWPFQLKFKFMSL